MSLVWYMKKKYKEVSIVEKVLYRDQRGKHRTAIALKNRLAVLDWFLDHTDGTQLACSVDLGLSRHTVSRHLKAIMSEQKV